MGIKAVHFDGSTYLSNSSLSSVPSSSNYLFLSFWYRASISQLSANDPNTIFTAYVSSYYVPFVFRILLDTGFAPFTLVVQAGNPSYPTSGGPYLNLISLGIPVDDAWHHVMVSFDGSSGSHYYALDNSINGFGSNVFGNAPIWLFQWSDVQNWWIGQDALGFKLPADLAEFFFLTGTYVNITDDTVRAKFIDPDTLLPVPIDAGGLYPFFDHSDGPLVPQIFLSGNADLFPRNYPGWSATCVSQTDSDPTSQFTVIGDLQTADTDPFGTGFIGV